MALVKSAVRNGTVCYHRDSKKILVLLCLLSERPTAVWSDFFKAVCGYLSAREINYLKYKSFFSALSMKFNSFPYPNFKRNIIHPNKTYST